MSGSFGTGSSVSPVDGEETFRNDGRANPAEIILLKGDMIFWITIPGRLDRWLHGLGANRIPKSLRELFNCYSV